jgi:two-component system cell cycle sensor histidine kinase PleC
MQRSADGRVLKAQLDLIADVLQAARFLGPLWALCVALLAVEADVFGAAQLEVALVLPGAVAVATLAAMRLVTQYRSDAAAHASYERLEPWFGRFIAVQVSISAAWGLMPWLLWRDDSLANHLFLAFAVVSVLSWLIVSRVSHMDMFRASVTPLVVLAGSRFLLGGSLTDLAITAALAIYTAQMFHDGRRLTKRLDEDSRLRFEVEDLARELEEARDEALRKRFEAETANASKTAFLANMSHELRTPLNAILGFSEIIAKECFGAVGSPRYIEYAGDIHASGAHLLSLINDLLDVAKIEAGRMEIQPEPLDPTKTFESALKLIGAKAREHHQELVIKTDPDAPELYADERALKQILINLVSNAVKFTPEGGRITVLGSRARCGGFQIMVEDNGPGIPREKLDRIFKPFSQVDNRYDRQGGGTGLGLALVRGLSELHGGRAWLESEPGKGCRAYVIFPQRGSRPIASTSDSTGGEDASAAA